MQGTRLLTLALPLTLALGFGLGYLVGGSATEPAAAGAHAAARRDAGQAPPPQRSSPDPVAPTTPLPARAEDGREDPAEARRFAASALRRAEASLDPALASGSEGLTGVVLAGDGQPLGGVTVAVTPMGFARDRFVRDTESVGQGWEDADEASFDAQAESLLRSRKLRRTTVTGDDGRFEIEGLPDESLSVAPYLEGYAARPTSVDAGADVTLTMGRVGVFRIAPRLPEGEVPEEAIVTEDDGGYRPSMLRWTKGSPEVRLESRTARIAVVAGESLTAGREGVIAEYTSDPRTIDLDADGDGPHVFELRQRTVLAVTVQRPGAGQDSSRIRVTARPENGEEIELNSSSRDRYVLADAVPGTYEVGVARTSDRTPTTTNVVVEPGWNEASVTLEPADESDFIVVRVTDTEGRRVPDVKFRSRVQHQAGGSNSGSVRPQSRPGGEHWIAWTEFDGRGEEQVRSRTLIASSTGYGSIRAEVTEPGQRISMQFQAPAECTVQVTGEITDPLVVQLTPNGPDTDPMQALMFGRQESAGEVPPDGVVDLGRFQPGEYTLSIRKKDSGRNFAGRESVSREVILASGPTRLTIGAPVEHSLVVTVPENEKQALMRLSAQRESGTPFGNGHQPTSTEGTTARFDDLLEGTYRLSYHSAAEGRQEMLVDVPCAPVTFSPMRTTGFAVLYLHDGGTRGPGGLRVGDVLTGFDGTDATEKNFMAQLDRALMERDVTLRFEHDGAQRTVTLSKNEDGIQSGLQSKLWVRSRLE